MISRYGRGLPLPPEGHKSVPNWQAKYPDFRAFGALAAAADMRITPDLHRRSRRKTLHTFHKKKFGPPFFDFPPYFFKVADLRFNTFIWTLNVRYDAVGGPYGL